MLKLIVILFITLGLLFGTGIGHAQQLLLTTSMTSPLSKADQTGFYDQVLIEAFRRIEQPVNITHFL